MSVPLVLLSLALGVAGDAPVRRPLVLPDATGPKAPDPPPAPDGPRRVQSSADAHTAALVYLKSLLASGRASANDLAFARLVWVPPWWDEPGDGVTAKLVSLTANYASRAETLHRPAWQPAGRLVLVDLRRFAPAAEDLVELLRLWEEFRFDPTFSRLVTKDTINLLLTGRTEDERAKVMASLGIQSVGKTGKFLVGCRPYQEDGETFSQRWVDVVRLPSPHLDPGIVDQLEKLTGSEAPVVEAHYFMFRSLNTIKDAGIFRTIWGGLYYDLAGIKTAKQAGKKGTDEDEFFRRAGVGDVDKGLTAKAIFDRARSDERAGLFRSNVTTKPRRVDVFPALSVRPRDGVSLLSVTHDVRNQDRDVARHAMLNGEDFKDFAREDFYPGPNGLLRFALFNGDGALQEKAPPDVVRDNKIPAPHTDELAGPISCIRCHGADGADGWQPVRNDFLKLRPGRPDLFDDLDADNLRKSSTEVVDRFAGRYGGNFEFEFTRARSDYKRAILNATGPWPGAKDQTEVGRLSALAYQRTWEDYVYAPVTARQALREIGWDVPADGAAEFYRALVPPDVLSDTGAFLQEDVRVGLLGRGAEIDRKDWDLIRSFVETRARQAEKKAGTSGLLRGGRR